MSRRRTKAQAKRRKRRTERPTLDAELAALAAEDAGNAAADRSWYTAIRLMQGNHDDYHRPKRNEFDQWELAELTRRNEGKSGDDLTLRLTTSPGECDHCQRLPECAPCRAYEVRRLMRCLPENEEPPDSHSLQVE